MNFDGLKKRTQIVFPYNINIMGVQLIIGFTYSFEYGWLD